MRYDQDEGTPTEVTLSRIDVPFLELTWFFIKASLAMALAFSAPAVAPTPAPGDIAPAEPEPPAPRDPNREATEAAQRAEIERLRKEKGQR
jgi:hypothetical protein